MDWKDYEIYITRHFRRLFPSASIRHNVNRIGLISGASRQIDILIEQRIAGFDLTIVVDCKYFNKNVDITAVESFLSFLGLGIQAPQASWGSLLADGAGAINPVRSFWWLLVFPAVSMALTLLALNFLGDALRDAFDSKAR